jgi:hypothetical protein
VVHSAVTYGHSKRQLRGNLAAFRSYSQADSASSILVTRSSVKYQARTIFRRRLLVRSLFEPAVRAINVQLAAAAKASGVGLAATSAGRMLRLDVRVDRRGNQLVGTASPVLVDDRGPFAVVPHPGHQVPQPGAADRAKVIPGVAKIVKVQAFGEEGRGRPGSGPLQLVGTDDRGGTCFGGAGAFCYSVCSAVVVLDRAAQVAGPSAPAIAIVSATRARRISSPGS